MSEASRVNLRAAHPGDIRTLATAEIECFEDPWPDSYFASELFAPARFQRVMIDSNGELVAYLFAAWQYLNLHILKVATLRPFRRLGLGTELMIIAEKHAKQMAGETLILEVRFTNTAAIKLYETLGYEPMGTRCSYYADDSNALVMTKRVV